MKFNYLIILYLITSVISVTSCQVKKDQAKSTKTNDGKKQQNDTYFISSQGDTIYKVVLSDPEWKKRLDEKEFYVLRKKGTERAFTGDLLDIKKNGIYTCRGCGHPLFASKAKFESGSGWPSFYDVIDQNGIHKETDYEIGYPRTELTCAKCGGHLGHVFDDGPQPTGLRYCINSVSLDFVEEKK
jgi:peptide-methionine (R)-S-oxide reductase